MNRLVDRDGRYRDRRGKLWVCEYGHLVPADLGWHIVMPTRWSAPFTWVGPVDDV